MLAKKRKQTKEPKPQKKIWPVLAGSMSYRMAETIEWEEGLDKKWWQVKKFYLVLIIILVSSLLINFNGISPVKAPLYAAVLYGITSPRIDRRYPPYLQ